MVALHDMPLVVEPYTAYRIRTPYGWCMIGAMSHEEAMREAWRSNRNLKPETLEVWDGKKYVFVQGKLI